MCRLFGLAAPEPVWATFWLLDAPDSLAVQSRGQPDGTGLAVFDEAGEPVLAKAPLAAYADAAFATEAREVRSRTFLAHVRYASTGAARPENTHPFLLDGRFFAHNGVVEGLADLDRHLGADLGLVIGDTDSERVFALVTREVRAAGGDVAAGLAAAVAWIAESLPVYALNVVLTDSTDLWALRYPDTHPLYVLQRPAGGSSGGRHLDAASGPGRIRVRSGELAATPSVVVATEPMDAEPGWTLLAAGELLHVDATGTVHRRLLIDRPPAYRLTSVDLEPAAAASQAH
jgi:predicted glutamine amidotransferase